MRALFTKAFFVCAVWAFCATTLHVMEGLPCNSLRRAGYVLIGFFGLLGSAIGLGYALRYGIYQARNWRQNAVAGSAFFGFFVISVQAAIFLLASTAADCGAENIFVKGLS